MATDLFRRNRNFRLLISGAAAANLGDGIAALALPWLATMISRDPFDIAIVAFATRLPWFLLSLPVGVVTDRADRQALIFRADLARVALSIGIVALILMAPSLPDDDGSARLLIGAIAALAFALGTAEVFRDNAAQTVLPMLVDERDLETANGQIWSVERVMGSFVGPPLAGLLIALAVPLPFSVNALAFGLAALTIWSIAFPARKLTPSRAGFWAEMRYGMRWIATHRAILQLAIMLGLMNALHIAAATFLVLFSQEVLGLGSFGHGVLLTAGAGGGVVGGLVCPRIAARLGPRTSLIAALVLMPLSYFVLFFTSSTILAAAALFLEILAGMLWNVVTVSYRQRFIPEAILGRVNAIYRFFGWGMMPVGALLAGLLVAQIEPVSGREAALRAPFLVAGLGMVAMCLYAIFALKLGRRGVA